jgi:hypothetical protein
MSEEKLTDKQITNWRRILSLKLGPYAFLMSIEEVKMLRDKMQEHVDKSIEKCTKCKKEIGDDGIVVGEEYLCNFCAEEDFVNSHLSKG